MTSQDPARQPNPPAPASTSAAPKGAAIHIVGGGLAGSEAAWQLAERGHSVVLHEMRPLVPTAAHKTERLAELVCSNTFKSTEVTNAHGLLKAEMRALGSLILWAADQARVPGGTALTVDRDVFSSAVHSRIESHPAITILREEAVDIPSPGIVATGPLTSDRLSAAIRDRLGVESLSFYDAIAPIIARESIDDAICFRASRYDKETMGSDSLDPPGAESARISRGSESLDPPGQNTPGISRGSESLDPAAAPEGAYFNCPFTREEYYAFVDALIAADQHHGHEFDEAPYFEGCMPAEEMAKRGRDTLRFGPMKPVGLRDPRSNSAPYAVAQLRMEDRGGRMWNLVGFQTRLRIPEQQRVFRMIPGLANAEFLRFGAIHRNSYVNSPASLTPHLSLRDDPLALFAGQLTGVEGYTESSATGLLAGINLSRMLHGGTPALPPPTTMLGALYRYLREADPRHFQPMNANFGLVDDLPERIRDKQQKRERFSERALADLRAWIAQSGIAPVAAPMATA